MLDGEWPQVRQGFDRWLDPANLAGGRQSLRLGALTAPAIPGSALRRATIADEAALASLQNAAYAPNRPILGVEPVPLLTPASDVLARYEVWLADAGAAPAGALVLDPHPDHLTIWSVAVDPAYQGAGFGNELLAAAESRARDLDLLELRLYTGDKLARNIDWYARRGYATERVEDLPDRRLVHMHKRLA
jgi:ribosomal protein S18 acetylase RimI-like enzyme